MLLCTTPSRNPLYHGEITVMKESVAFIKCHKKTPMWIDFFFFFLHFANAKLSTTMLTFKKESPNVGVLLICSPEIDAISSFFIPVHSAVHKDWECYTQCPRITIERIDRLILSRSMHRVIIHDQLASF